MIRLNQITMPVGHSVEELQQKCLKALKLSSKDLKSFTIVKQSIDARKKPDIIFSYVVDIGCPKEAQVLKQSKVKK
jgi:uncharacterized FAD-dependent dehydrogenase